MSGKTDHESTFRDFRTAGNRDEALARLNVRTIQRNAVRQSRRGASGRSGMDVHAIAGLVLEYFQNRSENPSPGLAGVDVVASHLIDLATWIRVVQDHRPAPDHITNKILATNCCQGVPDCAAWRSRCRSTGARNGRAFRGGCANVRR